MKEFDLLDFHAVIIIFFCPLDSFLTFPFKEEYQMSTNESQFRMNRRAFLRAAGLAGTAALAACAAPPAAAPSAPAQPAAGATAAPQAAGAEGGEISFLWSDTENRRAPLIEDFTKATGIKVNQTIVQYNERLNKINTAVQGGGGFDVVQMEWIWTA
jgi:ABC-type glycerol-3-phosphate transport system substrate-binding protein